MARKKLTVNRKGYWRKAHERRTPSGRVVKVKRTFIPKSRFKTMDRGAVGRTPKSEQWFEPKGSLYGWGKDLSERARHQALNESVRKDGYATTIRRLNALRNVSTDAKTDRVAKADMIYLKKKYRPEAKGIVDLG